MTTAQLMLNINDRYTEDMSSTTIMKMISDHFNSMPASKSAIDPQRLGSQSTFISRLRKSLMQKVGPLDVDGQEEFNKMDVEAQLSFQKLSQTSGLNRWVHSLEIMPRNIAAIAPPSSHINMLKNLRDDIDTGKLRDELVKVDVDNLIAKLSPFLYDGKRHQTATALLLFTGRRTIEILQTAKFYLGKNQTPDGYKCYFSGQAKTGLEPIKDYEIPLLAPFNVVAMAMQRIRSQYDTSNMTSEEVNYFSVSIGAVTKKLGLNPHALRSVYALATYKLLKSKCSLIGYISKVLGHVSPQNAMYYSRLKVVNFSGPYKPTVVIPETTDDWVINGLVEQKRLAGIKQMMIEGKKLTASSIRQNAGGTSVVAARIIRANQKIVDGYNSTLE